MSATGPRPIIEALLASEIGVHQELSGQVLTYGLHPEVIRWLDSTLRPGQRTLETGCGLSTAVFAIGGTNHTTIMPFGSEAEKITTWCIANGVDVSGVEFIIDYSEDVLPGLDMGDLDLVLIDGSHAFPQVFIDWFYAARALRMGGIVIVDDVQLWPCRTLRDFLDAEDGWELVGTWPRTTAFRKTRPLDPLQSFSKQPYVVKRSAYSKREQYLALLREDGPAGIVRHVRAAVTKRRS